MKRPGYKVAHCKQGKADPEIHPPGFLLAPRLRPSHARSNPLNLVEDIFIGGLVALRGAALALGATDGLGASGRHS